MKPVLTLVAVVVLGGATTALAALPTDVGIDPNGSVAASSKPVASLRKGIGVPPITPALPQIGRLVLDGKPAAADAGASASSSGSVEKGASIVGSYRLDGRGDDGNRYRGVATITNTTGELYSASWTIGSNAFAGACFRDQDTLSCGWARKAKDANVVAYLVGAGSLDGVWFGAGDTKLGTELLSPKTANSKGIGGPYIITSGKSPDGSKYSGTSVVTELVNIGPGFYKLEWVIGGSPVTGLGIRPTERGASDVLSVGFADSGKEYGAEQYHIDPKGGVLSGSWIQAINGKFAAGTETATRQ